MIIDSKVRNLLLLLDLFDVEYDQKDRKKLFDVITSPSTWKKAIGWSDYNS